MTLTPKHWVEFQHYKDRSPVWIKLHRKLLDDFSFNRLPLASRALAPMLWLLASEYDGGKITATPEEIAFRLRITEQDLREALNPLITSGFFECDSDVLADCKQEAIPENIEKRHIEKRREDIRAVEKSTRPPEPKDFEEFWKTYPKRDGANPKAPARNLYLSAIKSGVDPAAILGGLRQYAEKERKNIGTEYIPQAVKWLRNRYWEGYEAHAPPSDRPAYLTPPPGCEDIETIRARYAAANGKADATGIETEIRSDAGLGQVGPD